MMCSSFQDLCPEDWQSYGNKCIVIVILENGGSTWFEANSICTEQHDAQLVTFDTAADLNFLVSR